MKFDFVSATLAYICWLLVVFGVTVAAPNGARIACPGRPAPRTGLGFYCGAMPLYDVQLASIYGRTCNHSCQRTPGCFVGVCTGGSSGGACVCH
ncbi:hypothetical protein BV898_17748 [Hypsibius exemplaris]|uniref:Invertebrate defensins family profile domain-containing protein n=1 Tax=Hypsibius exemplaris TaxID=2072580 RepID=A0A9X6RMC4_HYPEX|nr:hypothetical protein BV898_17748 [Hypsibius exemplaris]